MMRAIMLLACVVVVGGLQRGTLGDITANWLSTTWISTGGCSSCWFGAPEDAAGTALAWRSCSTHLPAVPSPPAVILGVPLLKALLGPQYSSLGVVAGISSFIFQLPLMLILFEVSR